MRATVECPHCGKGVIVETKTQETMTVEQLPSDARCLAPVPHQDERWPPPLVPVVCRLRKGHGGRHRSETDMFVWEG